MVKQKFLTIAIEENDKESNATTTERDKTIPMITPNSSAGATSF